MRRRFSFLIPCIGIAAALSAPAQTSKAAKYVDWKTFKLYGFNLGGWLVQESTIDTTQWDTYSGGAADE